MAPTVSTTRPLVDGILPLPIFTDRLIIRSFRLSDLEAYHTLQTQPEAHEGYLELVSTDLSCTEDRLKKELPPYESRLYLGIYLKKSDDSEGDLIGNGGMQNLHSQKGWPNFGYQLKKEYWNKGYATEFATAFMRFWWGLPRERTNLEITYSSVDFQDRSEVAERVYASAKLDNKASQRVLEKLGFEPFGYIDNKYGEHICMENIFSVE
uniref:hypothetical protein n=1 Tax=Pseudofabraea citricarpa TaxID=1664388 RepID=UPI0022FD7092|nr:hypothetical protein PN052_mgp25 [Pseudofabraea citricarpa]WAX38802.1 hypothetical protein [Pseudofabraea citricarpa]